MRHPEAKKEQREAVVATKFWPSLQPTSKVRKSFLVWLPINPDESQELSLSFLSLEDFEKCKISLLKAFAHVRLFSWPSKKGTVQDALRGDDCYLLRALNCRSKPVSSRVQLPWMPKRMELVQLLMQMLSPRNPQLHLPLLG